MGRMGAWDVGQGFSPAHGPYRLSRRMKDRVHSSLMGWSVVTGGATPVTRRATVSLIP